MIDVYWWSYGRFENSEFENFGDALVPYLLNLTTTESYQWVRPNASKVLGVFKKKHYLIIGSILNAATRHSVVWGSGIIHSQEHVKKAKFLTVRGPKSRQRLLSLGHHVPEVYGDPAILLALFFKQKREDVKYEFGIVPHYVDYKAVKEQYADYDNVKIINLLTDNVEDVILQFLQCKHILSSSLHGLIVAHAFRIPALWTKISNKLTGDDIKFEDYYNSVNLYDNRPIAFKSYQLKELEKLFSENSAIRLPLKSSVDSLIKDLTRTFPFKKTKKFKLSIRNYFDNND